MENAQRNLFAKFRLKRKRQNRNYYSSYIKIVAASFFAVIMTGTLLLMLPVSIKTGSVNFLDALLTATSATCVTGLVIFDTFSKWTLFGQIVIICLIQIGGLGFITILTMLSRFIKKRVSLREKLVLQESFGSIPMGNTKKIVRVVLIGTAFFEITGALILCTQFIPQMGFKNGLFTSVFLSVSAFCNAGFDVLGRIEPGSSLVTVNTNPVILLTIASLIIIGGIGFIVWDDIAYRKFRAKRFTLHTKLTLLTTAVLLIGGTVLFYIFERDNTFAGMTEGQKILNAFFASVTPRTAGFNSVPVAQMATESEVVTDILMFIGGSPGSTAGGIKTATVAVIFLCTFATLKNSKDIEVFGKRISVDVTRKATSIFIINLMEIFISTFLISILQPELAYSDILFECLSALGTVGMTTGITPLLDPVPEIIVTLLMFIGRITSLLFAFIFILDSNKFVNRNSQKPKGTVLVG